MKRYDNRTTYMNTKKLFDPQFKAREVDGIRHYGTPDLKHLTIEQIKNLEVQNVIWKAGDKLYKLAHEYYNNPELWWVIAWFNRKPTDAHYKAGDVVYIPGPIQTVLSYYGY
mgnify:CR=1 FL=1